MSTEQVMKAELSRLKDGETIDAWGLARVTGCTGFRCEWYMLQLVDEGILYRDGNWFGLNKEYQNGGWYNKEKEGE